MFKKTINTLCDFTYSELIECPEIIRGIKWTVFEEFLESVNNNRFQVSEENNNEEEYESFKSFLGLKGAIEAKLSFCMSKNSLSSNALSIFRKNNVKVDAPAGKHDFEIFIKMSLNMRNDFLREVNPTLDDILKDEFINSYFDYVGEKFMERQEYLIYDLAM